MKNLKLGALSVCLTFWSHWSTAQNVQGRSVSINEPDYDKPKLFDDLPERINFDPAHLSVLFNTQVGQFITVSITQAFVISGPVVSKSEDANSSSVVVRLAGRPGARLIFTKLTRQNSSVKYIGRIISMKNGDSYEIAEENDQYFLKKKGIYEIITE